MVITCTERKYAKLTAPSETLDDIAASLQTAKRKSLKRLVQETGAPVTRALGATRQLQLRQYKTTAVRALKELDPVARVRSRNCFLPSVRDEEVDPVFFFR